MHLIAIGGSDAGISAALRARELDPGTDVTVVVADAYPNFSICGIPYYVSGEVTHWRNLAHRTLADLEATGMNLRLDTVPAAIDVEGRKLLVTAADGTSTPRPMTSWSSAPAPSPPGPDRRPRWSGGPRARRWGPPTSFHGRHLRPYATPWRRQIQPAR